MTAKKDIEREFSKKFQKVQKESVIVEIDK